MTDRANQLERCHDVLREAVSAFPEHLRPEVVTNHVGNPLVEIGGAEVWCIPWCKATDKMLPGTDYLIGSRRNDRAVETVSACISGRHHKSAVRRVRTVMLKALEERKLELAGLEEMAAHL